MAIFYSDTELSRRLGQDFHRDIKPLILRDARHSGYLLKLRATNPDIGLEDNVIYLRDPRNTKIVIKTDLDINSYL